VTVNDFQQRNYSRRALSPLAELLVEIPLAVPPFYYVKQARHVRDVLIHQLIIGRRFGLLCSRVCT